TKVTGDKAKALTRTLKYAGVKPTATKLKWTFAVKQVECHVVTETDDKLGSHDCVVDGKKLADAAALLIYEGLQAAGIEDKYGMAKRTIKARDLTCVDDQAAHGDTDAVYVCTFDAGT
ncbi:MAG TPA: hypothetical protein VGO00_14645, partial [Kofleriaceae bacterium]|nr:hypothetical protein [Kofleriaceae bacterium]